MKDVDSAYNFLRSASTKNELERFINEKCDFFETIVDVIQSVNANALAESYDCISAAHINIQKNNNLAYHPIDLNVPKDADCFFYSVAKLLFGHQKFFKFVKVGVVFIYIKHKDIFFKICDDKKIKWINQVKESISEDLWVNEIDILATSILIKRPIHIYTFLPDVRYYFFLSKELDQSNPIYVAHDSISKVFLPLMGLPGDRSISESKSPLSMKPDKKFEKYFLSCVFD
jgi:hypothetical protein